MKAMYECPKCRTEFSLGTKFCQECGCNLNEEFIKTPICPKCKKEFKIGTKFCDIDGSKLVSPEKLIPKHTKCGIAGKQLRKMYWIFKNSINKKSKRINRNNVFVFLNLCTAIIMVVVTC
jgi:predicted amidophosphoribosyltransferase